MSGKSHGQRSLAGHSPWGLTESDRTEQLTHTKHKIRSRFCKKITWGAQRRGFGEHTGILELERTSQTGFLSVGTIDILGQIIFCWGGAGRVARAWPVHCRTVSSILGLNLPDSGSTDLPSSSCDSQKTSPDIAKYSLQV